MQQRVAFRHCQDKNLKPYLEYLRFQLRCKNSCKKLKVFNIPRHSGLPKVQNALMRIFDIFAALINTALQVEYRIPMRL